jgi:hypothetical protein
MYLGTWFFNSILRAALKLLYIIVMLMLRIDRTFPRESTQIKDTPP